MTENKEILSQSERLAKPATQLLSRRTVVFATAASTFAGIASAVQSNHGGQEGPSRLLDDESLQGFRHPSLRSTFLLPTGVFECCGLLLGSGTKLIGAGHGRTILRLPRGADSPVLRNADPVSGNHGLAIRDLTIDGSAAQQTRTLCGIQMERVSGSYFDVEVMNASGTGFLLSDGQNNRFGRGMHCHGNGRTHAGYGLYIFGSSNNLVEGGRYDDNCIGIAVEASRPGVAALNNRIIGVLCVANRADFGQSGAGVHFEQTEGGNCDGGIIIHATCINSTGVGINNTCCALKIEGGRCSNNREAAVVTIGAAGFAYDGIICTNNARGESTGYRSEMRFDDGGLRPGSTGIVSNCRLMGDAPDGGIRTMSTHSAIRFVGNTVRGYRFPYILSSNADTRT